MLSVRDLAIDEEFAAVFAEDRHQPWQIGEMEESVRKNGWLQPLYHWHGLLVDGHTRYEIWETKFKDDENFPEPEVKELYFKDRAEVLEFIMREQVLRRNLNDNRAAYWRGKYSSNSKESMSEGRPEPQVAQTVTGKRARGRPKAEKNMKAVADKAGVSRATLHRNEVFSKAVDNLVERGVGTKDELLQQPAKAVVKAAQTSTKTDANKVLKEAQQVAERRKAMEEPGDIARRFAIVTRELGALNTKYPWPKYSEMEKQLREWCQRIVDHLEQQPVE